jgi:hypothetical protein
VLIYAAAITLVTIVVGILVFFYMNLGTGHDSLARANRREYTSSGTGDWDDASHWEKSQTWMNDTPGNNVNADVVNIRGYITSSGNLSIGGKTVMTIYDTLRVIGDLTVGAGSELIIEEKGLLIVENDYITNGGARTHNDGTVVGIRNFRGTGGSEVENNHLFYVFGDIRSSGGSTYNGAKNEPENANFLTERTLMDNNPPLYEFSSGIFVMPITLAYFQAEKDGDQTLLKWGTINEENNDFFTIERSRDGKQFEIIDQIKGAGNSDVELSYSFVDPEPLQGANYYRLKQTDYNGDFEYFNIEVVYHDFPVENANPINIDQVWPNPFQQQFSVRFEVQESANVKLTLTDMQGQVKKDLIYAAYPGSNEIKFQEGSKMTPGIYLLTLSYANYRTEPMRLVKR